MLGTGRAPATDNKEMETARKEKNCILVLATVYSIELGPESTQTSSGTCLSSYMDVSKNQQLTTDG